MPKKAKLDVKAAREVLPYCDDVKGSVYRLGLRLGKHFTEKDERRARFLAIETLVNTYLEDTRKYLARIRD